MTSREALRVARAIHAYLAREDALPGEVAKFLFDNLKEGGTLRLMDLILAWMTMQSNLVTICGDERTVPVICHKIISNL